MERLRIHLPHQIPLIRATFGKALPCSPQAIPIYIIYAASGCGFCNIGMFVSVYREEDNLLC